MKVYLAHNFIAKGWLSGMIVPKLEAIGIEVTSRWITRDVGEPPYSSELQKTESQWDVEDIERADVLVLFTDQVGHNPGRGKYVEFGFALGLNKTIVLCGREENCVFYHLPGLIKVLDIYGLIDQLYIMHRPALRHEQDAI